MNSGRRLREWKVALRLAHGVVSIPWSKMLLAMLTPVPKRIWRERIRRCRTCPMFDNEHYICCGTFGPFAGIGCRCYLPFKAFSAEPYVGKTATGCYGRALNGGDFGWGAYVFPSRREKWTAFVRFLLRR